MKSKPHFVPFDDNDIRHVESPWAPYYDPDPVGEALRELEEEARIERFEATIRKTKTKKGKNKYESV